MHSSMTGMALTLNRFTRVLVMIVAALSVSLVHAQAAPTPLLSEVRTLASESLPSEKTLEIPADGDYTITLTDFAWPAAMDAIKLAITRGDTVVTTLERAEVGHKFTATKGTHVIRVVGIPSAAFPSDSFGVEVRAASGGALVLQYSDVLSFIPQDAKGQGIVAGSFASSGGDYEVVLSDFKLPQALNKLVLGITRAGSSDVFAMGAAGSQTFTLPAASYQLYVIGQAETGETAGLFGVRIRSVATGATVFSQTMPIGGVAQLGAVNLEAGAHSLTFTDLAFPTALARGGAAATLDGVVAVSLSGTSTGSFSAVAGEYSLFAYATPSAATASGSYGVEVRKQGGAQVFSAAKAVGGAAGATPSYVFPIDVSAGGAYRVRLTDFEMPARLDVASLAATQAGVLLGSISSAGSLDLNLVPGKVFLLVIAKPTSASGALFGVDVTPTAGSSALFEATQGVGSLFDVRKVSITTAGRYTVGITDLKFPKRFTDLIGVVTRGAERKGSILGGGAFNFDAMPGEYSINFLAQAALLDETKSSTQKAGTYAMTVAPATPAPTITLSVSPAQVKSGGSVDIMWSTTDADTCTATGGWTGSKQPKGAERSAAITASTTYTITCSGAGGSATQSASVAITSSAKSGGGGAIEWLTLAMLSGAGVLAAFARRRRESLHG